jgi:hypothetical protein
MNKKWTSTIYYHNISTDFIGSHQWVELVYINQHIEFLSQDQ